MDIQLKVILSLEEAMITENQKTDAKWLKEEKLNQVSETSKWTLKF